jgi:protocatechuate 3,4-dioxygenase beta subunit
MHRMDIREGKKGVPLDLTINVVDVRNSCRPVAGARVDVWQCDSEGIYSGVKNLELEWGARRDDTRGATFLRGVQATDADGRVRFQTIYPGWYPTRITHIHFQIFGPKAQVFTSQIAFPQEITRSVYQSPSYRPHGQNSSVHSLAEDNVFGDGPIKYHLLKMKGDVRSGFTGIIDVAIAAGA